MVGTEYKEIVDYLREARLDLENAEDVLRDKIKKIRKYLDENPDEEQFEKLEYLESRLQEIEDIIEEIEDVIRDLS